MSVTAVQISERRQKVKTTVSDESIKMRKFISMTMTMLKIGFIGFGGGSALIPVIEDEVVEKDKIVSEEEFNDDKKIIVFDSLATSGLETLVAKKIKALAESGKNTDDIQKEIESYIVNNTGLYFCLESLDALKSNGRLFALAAKVLEKIRVKLICRRTTQGNISLAAQDITLNHAMMKMSNLIANELEGKDLSGETLVISYVCCEDRAKQVAAKICEKAKFGNVEILKASGLNSLYASDGGIIVSYSF